LYFFPPLCVWLLGQKWWENAHKNSPQNVRIPSTVGDAFIPGRSA
jgi:hypothetical protein